jgi:hypothetical protein
MSWHNSSVTYDLGWHGSIETNDLQLPSWRLKAVFSDGVWRLILMAARQTRSTTTCSCGAFIYRNQKRLGRVVVGVRHWPVCWRQVGCVLAPSEPATHLLQPKAAKLPGLRCVNALNSPLVPAAQPFVHSSHFLASTFIELFRVIQSEFVRI